MIKKIHWIYIKKNSIQLNLPYFKNVPRFYFFLTTHMVLTNEQIMMILPCANSHSDTKFLHLYFFMFWHGSGSVLMLHMCHFCFQI